MAQQINTIVMILMITMAIHYGGVMAQLADSLGCTTAKLEATMACGAYSVNPTLERQKNCAKGRQDQQSACNIDSPGFPRQMYNNLCQVLNDGGSSLGLNINQTQALALPTACNVQTPPTSQCNVGSPTKSPSDTTPSSTPSSGNPSDNGSSDAASTSYTTIPLAFSLLVLAYATVF
ncbi:Bifunctional inhibitor/plant lipid transfer protein/seed storage helical domain-containing protein [Artemisia annua]|uniref:Bifunctional inhibitor/plant lipid transfer protein/seed storage helical domain-containing protein n=1 Tax=Artemisia annua TaxID=35608 RepID=A0A2U1Q6E4_ARTAN|nr:Bifunctional inhibitor/plant lipid transfer protein/seed storage helical domain-containing protein [Artemisia annua]